MSLIKALKQVRDYRTRPQYPLWVILLLVLMGTMSGCVGYRDLEAFVVRHQAQLLEYLEIPHQRLPSYSTIRRALVRVDFASLTQVFNDWARSSFEVEAQAALAVDGKSIKVSLKDYDRAYQDFVSLVSVFSVQQGLVMGLESMHNKDKSEIATVQTLLERLQLQGSCYSLDALHAKKNGSADHCSRQ
jgi:DDE_Tnp_1-associated